MRSLRPSQKFCVRPATSDDFASLLYMGEEARKEGYAYFPPIDADWAVYNLNLLLMNYENGCAFVAEDKDMVFGFLIGRADRFTFSRVRWAMGEIIYIIPSYRTKYPWASVSLLRRFMQWGKNVAKWQFFRMDNPHDLERKQKLLERVGLKPFGGPMFGVYE